MRIIECASHKDFEAIGALNVMAYAEFAQHLSPGGWEVMQKNLRNIAERAKTAEFLVFRSGAVVVGSVAYCPPGKGDPTIFKSDMAAVLLLAVHPNYRGNGLAKALTEACISRARNDGASSIGLFTSELMVTAQHIYRSLGFQEESELPRRHGRRYFRYVLRLAPM